MIITTLYYGQGLGNQLWSWAVLKSIAEKRGFEWGIQCKWRFKGKSLFKIDLGKKVYGIPSKVPNSKLPVGISNYYVERKILSKNDHFDISEFDSQLVTISDNTKIDGIFQSEQYIYEFKEKIVDELKLDYLPFHESTRERCVMHLRGGDFRTHDQLFLKQQYFENAINEIRKINPEVEILIVTNDVSLAKEFFPDFKIISNYGLKEVYSGPDRNIDIRTKLDFAAMQNADYLILSNSSFSWWAAWTNSRAKKIIGPKYWARHNMNSGYWSTGGIITKNWDYLDSTGSMYSYSQCIEEYRNFKKSDKYNAANHVR